MKSILQTKFGKPGGNCFAACVASLLEVDLNSLPNFCLRKGDWWDFTQRWLKEHYGLGLITFDDDSEDPAWAQYVADGAYCIVSGTSPRNLPHSTVGQVRHSESPRVQMIHDPHPSGAGLVSKDEYTFFIAVDPSVSSVATES